MPAGTIRCGWLRGWFTTISDLLRERPSDIEPELALATAGLNPSRRALLFHLLESVLIPASKCLILQGSDRAFDAGLATLLHCAEIDRYPVGDSRVRITSYPSLRPHPKCRIQIKRHRLAAR